MQKPWFGPFSGRLILCMAGLHTLSLNAGDAPMPKHGQQQTTVTNWFWQHKSAHLLPVHLYPSTGGVIDLHKLGWNLVACSQVLMVDWRIPWTDANWSAWLLHCFLHPLSDAGCFKLFYPSQHKSALALTESQQLIANAPKFIKLNVLLFFKFTFYEKNCWKS